MAANGYGSLNRQVSAVQASAITSITISTPLVGQALSSDSGSSTSGPRGDPFSRSLSIHRNLRRTKISKKEAFAHVLKGNIGSGFLGIPFAMSLAGLGLGPPLLALICCISVYNMYLLLKCANSLAWRFKGEQLGYGDVVSMAFRDYFENDGKIGRRMVDTFLIMIQLGFCSVYFILIPQSIQTFVKNYWPDEVLDIKVYMVIMLVFIMILTFVWDMKTLAIFSTIGNISIFSGLALILLWIFLYGEFKGTSDLVHYRVTNLPIFFGMAIYAFEGIGLVLPLRAEMEEPEKCFMVTAVGMVFVLCLQIVFGILGFMCFRHDIAAVITFNLPAGAISSAALILVALCVFLTYPLMFYVPIEILMVDAKKYFLNYTSFTIEFWMRTSLVLVTFLFAVLIPHIELFIALVGALAASSLALIFPPITYLIMFRTNQWEKVLCCSIAMFGMFGLAIGTTYAVKDIVCALSGLPIGGGWPCKAPPKY